MIFYEDFFDNNFLGENLTKPFLMNFLTRTFWTRYVMEKNWPGGQNWPKARILDGKSKN